MIPKSTNPERMRVNADVFGFEIDEEDMAAIARDGPWRRGRVGRGGPDAGGVRRQFEVPIWHLKLGLTGMTAGRLTSQIVMSNSCVEGRGCSRRRARSAC